MKTILYYNWNSLNSPKGGGVNVYQKNVINNFKDNKDYKIVFLSSGDLYDNSNGKKPYIKKLSNDFGVEEYTIINSPVLAASKQTEENFKIYIEDNELAEIFINFCKSIKNLSIIHFNNLEGLSVNCLKVKEKIKNLKIIYSAHNYFSICPEVNLWYKFQSNCLNVECHDCSKCFKYPKRKMELTKRRVLPRIKNNHIKNLISKTIHLFYIFERDKKYETNYYEEFKKINVKYINKYCDSVVAVSNRVREILIDKGINKKIIKLNYIGNDFSSKKPKKCVANCNSKIFKIIYLGPMRKDKGFYFLVDALKNIPSDISKNIDVTFASKITDKNAHKMMAELQKTFNSVNLIDGYKRENLEGVLKDKNLGIVPILWEDNLPQVTIEMIACGVPVLCGNFGGAKEVASNKDFVFKSGDTNDFVKVFSNIYNNRKLLEDYYKNKLNLVSMDEHIKELIKIYN